MNSALQIRPIDKKLTKRFLDSLKIGDGFQYRVSEAATEPTIIASGTAVLLLNFLKMLDQYSDTQKKQWREYLLDSFDNSGMVNDEIDFANPTQDQPLWALKAHRTRHTAWAIEALDGNLQKPIEFLKPYLGKEAIAKWLDDLWKIDWPGIWRVGNWIMDMGVLLDLQYRHFNDQTAKQTLIDMLKLLNEKLEPATGFWRGGTEDDRNAMAGSMHLYPIYWAYDVELPYFDKAVDLTLKMQQSDGLFDYNVGTGGSQCLDYDAALVLINGYVMFDQKKNQIHDCFAKLRKAIEVNRKDTGSWSDSLNDEDRSWATKACVFNSARGSIWDTYARIMTVAMCDKILNPENCDWFKAEHHFFEIFDLGKGWVDGVYKD